MRILWSAEEGKPIIAGVRGREGEGAEVKHNMARVSVEELASSLQGYLHTAEREVP